MIILRIIVWLIVIIAFIAVLLLGFALFAASSTAEPSQEQARKQAEQLIGLGFGEGVEISHWYCESVPDLIVTCSFSLKPEKHQELIRYCEEKGLTPKECEQEHLVPEGERVCYYFETSHHGAPDDFHLERAFISLTTNNIYYYWADGA